MSGLDAFINRFNIIKQIPIFAKLNWFDQQKIVRKAVVEDYKKGEILIHEGSAPDAFYCLISGRVRAFTKDESGRKVSVEFIHRGMHFGVISVFTNENHSMSFEAINDSVVIKIPQKDFKVLLSSIPQLGVEFSHTLSHRIRRKEKGVHNIFESKIVSVYSPKMGTGSTTYAFNLALNLQEQTKKQVIFVHIGREEEDFKSNPKTLIWNKEPISIEDIAEDQFKVTESVVSNGLPVDLLNVYLADSLLAKDISDEKMTRKISSLISALVGNYHYVVVDLPNAVDETIFEALSDADLVHLLSTDLKEDLVSVRAVIDELEVRMKESFQADKVQVVVRPEEPEPLMSQEEMETLLDYSVYQILPFMEMTDFSEHVESSAMSFRRADTHTAYARMLKRVSREVGGVLLGVVLGGGAALGVAHIGVIRVLEREGIPVDVVIGSSMGALVGSMWAAGKNADQLEIVAREFEKKSAMLKLWDPVFPISGVVGGRAIKLWLKKHLGDKKFYDCVFPFKAVSYDLKHREELVIEKGLLVDAVRESIAIPGVIEPVQRRRRVIIDGGVLNPLPTNILARDGVNKIIAINVLQSPEDVVRGINLKKVHLRQLLKRRFWKAPHKYIGLRFGLLLSKIFTPNIADIVVKTLQATEYLLAVQSAQQADVVIHPDLTGIDWFELDKVDELIRAGEEAAEKALPKIKELVGLEASV